MQIIRVQSPDGMKKIPSTKRETAAAFLKKVDIYTGCSGATYILIKVLQPMIYNVVSYQIMQLVVKKNTFL